MGWRIHRGGDRAAERLLDMRHESVVELRVSDAGLRGAPRPDADAYALRPADRQHRMVPQAFPRIARGLARFLSLDMIAPLGDPAYAWAGAPGAWEAMTPAKPGLEPWRSDPLLMAGRGSKPPRRSWLARLRGGRRGGSASAQYGVDPRRRPRGAEALVPAEAERGAIEAALYRGWTAAAPFLSRIGRLVWDPLRLAADEPSYFEWLERRLQEDGDPLRTPNCGWFRHSPENPVTRRMIAMVEPHADWCRRHGDLAPIVGLGSGAGLLERALARQLDVRVLQTDLFPPADGTADWQREDLRDLSFAAGSKRVAVASFSLEYAGPKAFDEAARILDPTHGVLVALVHHQGSSIFPSKGNPMVWLGAAYVHLTTSIPLWRWLLPRAVRDSGEGMLRFAHDLRRAAFPTQDALRTQLRRSGFRGDIHIETAMSPPIALPNSSRLLDSGWIVVAKRR